MKNVISKMAITLLAVFILSSMFNLNVLIAGETTEPDQIWSFQEGDIGRKKPIEINTKKYSLPIIDINSVLTVIINKDVLRGTAAVDFGESSKEDMKKLLPAMDEIKAILEIESDFMKSIHIEPGDDKNTVQNKIKLYQSTLEKLLTVSKNPSSRIGKIINDTYFNTLSDPLVRVKSGEEQSLEVYGRIFTALSKEIATFSGELKEAIGEVTFRMGGWIQQGGSTQPIHIEGFDEYEPGQYTRIPFLTKQTPEEFAAKMEAVKNAAQKANEDGISAVLNINVNLKEMANQLKTELVPAITCVTDSATDIVNDIKGELTASVQLPETEKFLKQLSGLKEKALKFIDITNNLKSTASDLKTDLEGQYNLFFNAQMFSDGLKVDMDFSKIKEGFEKAADEIKSKLPQLKDVLKEKIKKILAEKMNICLDKFKDVQNTFIGFVSEFWAIVKNKFSVAKENEPILSDFGKKVKRLNIDDVPETGTINLQYTGARNEGDIITVRAALEKESQDGTPGKKVEFRQSFIMFQIFKVVINPGLIFADPLVKKEDMAAKGVTLGKTFQAVPSYSVLFKFGNRKSIAYNKYLRFGIGLNVAALDFNQDSNYELGLGVVLSAFKDYVQLGVGRNMESDTWYWFFGLNLPFTSISLPAGGGGTKPQ